MLLAVQTGNFFHFNFFYFIAQIKPNWSDFKKDNHFWITSTPWAICVFKEDHGIF